MSKSRTDPPAKYASYPASWNFLTILSAVSSIIYFWISRKNIVTLFSSHVFYLCAMSVKEILTFLDPKNQNLPSLKWGTGFSKVPLIYIPVVQGEEGELKKQFRELRDLHFSGKKESHLEVIKNNRVFRLIGIGKKDQVNARTMRRFFGKYYLNAVGGKPKQVAFYCPPEWITVAAVGIHVAALDPGMFKKAWKKNPQPTVALDRKSTRL